MKKVLVVIFILLSRQLAGQTNHRLDITHLTGDFYVYTTYNDYNKQPFPSNSMYLVTDGGVVLFDTPWDSTQFQPLLDSIRAKHHKDVILCIATHFHADRTAGFDFFRQKGIKTYSSAQTLALCKSHQEKQASFTFLKDTSFTIGNHSFETFYPGEGHTQDNIVIWFPREKILYGGCLVKSTEAPGLGNMADVNVNAWPTSINNIIKKYPDPTYIIPGHLGWSDSGSLRHTLKLLKEEEERIIKF